MKKIFYLANARMPTEKAHGIQIAKMCEAILENGVDLKLILPSRGDKKSIKEFYGLRQDIPAVFLPVLPFYGSSNIVFRLSAFSFIFVSTCYLWWQKIKGVKARVHLIDMDQISIGAIFFSPFPVTLEIHDAKPKNLWFNFIFSKTDLILTINNIIKDKLVERFSIFPKKIIVFPNGIDLDLFSKSLGKGEARGRLSLPQDERIVVYTGQFYSWKGLEIIPKVAELLSQISFYMVGGTRDDFQKVTGTSSLPKNIFFVGKRSFAEIPLWLSASDVALVLGTKRDEYSFYHTSPMKLFEYMASSVPIVASKTPAILDQVSDREVFFYEPDNVHSLKNVIDRVFREEDGAKRKVFSANQKAKDLTWQKRAQAIFGI